MSNFDPYAEGYSPLNALWLGKSARLAYSTPAMIQTTALEWGFHHFHFFDRDGTQGFIMANDDAIVLAFRGTEPKCLRDWMTDARIVLVPGCGQGLVHRGFWDGINRVWDEVSAKLKEFGSAGQPILVTGHSLGAALATLAAAKLQAQGQSVQSLYNFGSPRVGNQNFARWFDAHLKTRTFRFVNNSDLVTRVVPRAMFYAHVGRFVYFDSVGNMFEDMKFWNLFLERVKGGIEDFLQDNIKDHDMGLYEKNLLQNINKMLAARVAAATH